MADSLRTKFTQLLCDAREASKRHLESMPFTSPTSKHHAAAEEQGVNDSEGIAFEGLDSPVLTLDVGDPSSHTSVAVTWLMEVASTLIRKVTVMGKQLKFTQKLVEDKVETV